MAPITLATLNTATFGALNGNSALNTFCGGRIYRGAGPAGMAYPAIIFQVAAGGGVALSARDDLDADIQVKCIDDDEPTAIAGAGLIDAAMVESAFSAAGLSFYRVQPEQFVELDEFQNGQIFYHRGRRFRVAADRS